MAKHCSIGHIYCSHPNMKETAIAYDKRLAKSHLSNMYMMCQSIAQSTELQTLTLTTRRVEHGLENLRNPYAFPDIISSIDQISNYFR